MIYFVTGRPGSGKSYYALHLIVEELINGQRDVVTNLELKLPELRQFLQERYDKDIDLWHRVRLLTNDEVGRFFLHRGKGIDIPPVSEAQEKLGIFPDMSKRSATDPGVFYVIDEVHTHFHARNWQQFGLSNCWYQAQHRHLNDEIAFISQHPEQVDKQLRLLVQYWLQVINTGTDLWGKGYRGRANHIKVQWYQEPPPKRGPFNRLSAVKVEQLPIEVTIPGKLRLGDCYRTVKECFSVGGRVTETKKKMGKSPFWLLIPISLLLLAALSAPFLLSYASEKVVGSVIDGTQKATKKYTQSRDKESYGDSQDEGELDLEPFINGVYTLNNILYVHVVTPDNTLSWLQIDPSLVRVEPGQGIFINGRLYPVHSSALYSSFRNALALIPAR